MFADEVSSEQAVFAVNMWRVRGMPSSMRGNLSTPNGEVSSLVREGSTLCHVVSLENGGFVITSGDDCDSIAIRGFSDEGYFDPTIESPLKNLLIASSTSNSDSISRLAYGTLNENGAAFVRKRVDLSRLQSGCSLTASSAWKEILSPSILKSYGNGVSTVDDVCVAPFVKAKWNQGSYAGKPLYNYYTPNNYPCGCVATAMAQIMRHHEYPNKSVQRRFCPIYVDSESNLKYVYSYGGVYDWANMPYSPSSSISDTERQSIGKLTYDCGVSVEMLYTSNGSGAVAPYAAYGFVDSFDYQNANFITSDCYPYSDISIYTNLYKRAILSNLNAGFPVLLGIREDLVNGHAIVSDGYGYIGDDIYYHMNMGWGGSYNLWYTIPEINNEYNFNVLSTIVYNIFPSNTAEIVSGRIKDKGGNPLSGVQVIISSAGVSKSVTTSESGIWSALVESGKTYNVSTFAQGYVSQNKSTGVISASNDAEYPQNAIVGNIWDCDFILNSDVMVPQKITSFRTSDLLEGGKRYLYLGFSSALIDTQVLFSDKVNGSYKALPSSSVTISEDGCLVTAILEGEEAVKKSGFVQILGR